MIGLLRIRCPACPGIRRLPYFEVLDPSIGLSEAVAVSANFPPAFPDAWIRITGPGPERIWTATDGGATENLGLLSVTRALRSEFQRCLSDSACRSRSRQEPTDIHVVGLEASAVESVGGISGGIQAALDARYRLSSQLVAERTPQLIVLGERLGIRVVFHTIHMPYVFRREEGLGTHWALPEEWEHKLKIADKGFSEVIRRIFSDFRTGGERTLKMNPHLFCLLESLYRHSATIGESHGPIFCANLKGNEPAIDNQKLEVLQDIVKLDCVDLGPSQTRGWESFLRHLDKWTDYDPTCPDDAIFTVDRVGGGTVVGSLQCPVDSTLCATARSLPMHIPKTNSSGQHSRVVLQAIPHDGYEFVNWEIRDPERGDEECGTSPQCSVTRFASQKVTAVFESVVPAKTHTISVVVHGAGTVSGLRKNDCVSNTPCKVEMSLGESVALLATVPEGDEFLRWDSDSSELQCEGELDCRFEVTTDTTLAAVFESVVPAKTHTISVVVHGAGTVSGLRKNDCVSNTPCKVEMSLGESVALLATVPEGDEFLRWDSDSSELQCEGELDCRFEVTTDTTLAAVFRPRSPASELLKLQVIGSGTIWVDGKLTCPPSCQLPISKDRSYSLTARPDSNYSFIGWEADSLCEDRSSLECSFEATLPVSPVIAIFSPNKFYFNTGEHTPAKESITDLGNAAKILTSTTASLLLVGSADHRGGTSANCELAWRRAATVARELRIVDRAILVVRGEYKTDCTTELSDDECWQKWRAVTLSVATNVPEIGDECQKYCTERTSQCGHWSPIGH